MCINSYDVHWPPTVLEFQWKSFLCQCGFVPERNHWIVPTHLQALRVQLLVVSEDFGICTSRPDLAPSGCAHLSCPCSLALPALVQCFLSDVCVVFTAHSHSWVSGAEILF